MNKLMEFLNYEFTFSKDIHITLKAILLVIVALLLTSLILKLLRKLITKKLPDDDKVKFISLFSYSKWFIYAAQEN